MTLNSSEVAVYTESIEAHEHSSAEIELYSELIEFEHLPPEEQARLAVHPEIKVSQDNPPEAVAQSTEGVSDLDDASPNVMSAAVAEKESAEGVEPQSFSDAVEAEQHLLSGADAGVTTPRIEDVNNSENESSVISFDNESSIVSFDNESSVISSDIADHDDAVAMCSGNLTSEPAASEEMDTPATTQADADEISQTSEAEPDDFVRSGGPLENLDDGIEFNGTLSRGVCLECGAETDDLFCLACGVFIEDIT